jgi:hypothetical protein
MGESGTVADMALLSQMFRRVAITGRTDTLDAWFATRQGGRWAEQKVASAFPDIGPQGRRPAPTDEAPPADPAQELSELEELHRRGVLTDTELDDLRARLST